MPVDSGLHCLFSSVQFSSGVPLHLIDDHNLRLELRRLQLQAEIFPKGGDGQTGEVLRSVLARISSGINDEIVGAIQTRLIADQLPR
jgi:hypothetical protein